MSGLSSLLGHIHRSSSYDDFLAQLADFDKIEDVDLPASLRPGITFRPYQKQGFNWLAFLHRFGLNGILNPHAARNATAGPTVTASTVTMNTSTKLAK